MKLQLAQRWVYLKNLRLFGFLGKTYKVKHINSTNIDNVMYTDSMIVIVKIES